MPCPTVLPGRRRREAWLALGFGAALVAGAAPDTDVVWVLEGAAARDGFGGVVVNVGDLTGDDQPELLAGAPLGAGDRVGSVRILSGAEGALLLEARSTVPDDHFGASVDLAGDIDGDGIVDLVVGCPRDAATDVRSGSVALVSGAEGVELGRLFGDRPFGELGTGVAGVGDVDGDGLPDIVASEPGARLGASGPAGGPGRVLCLSSAEGGGVLWMLAGVSAEERFGACLVRLPDLDGDGLDDVAVSAPGARPQGETTGRVLVLSGADGRVILHALGPGPGHFGSTLASAGDVDGDGRGDLLVGDPGALRNGHPAGAAWLLSGADGKLLQTYTAPADGARFGAALAGLGDVDGDGRPDVAVGSPADDAGGYRAGRVTVFSGKNGLALLELRGTLPGQQLGSALAGLGDVDGDERADLLVGLLDLGGPGATPGALRAVRARLAPPAGATGDAAKEHGDAPKRR